VGYSQKFLRAIGFILPHETDYVRGHWGDDAFVVTENVAGDSGGRTKYGIDASSHNGIDIADLDREQAIEIYFDEWQRYGIEALPEKIAVAQFDVRVNGGHATTWLQLAMNRVGGTHLTVDGDMGPATISAAQHLNDEQQRAVLVLFIRQRDARFEAIASGARAKFLAGWKQRDRDLEKYLGIA
jgi:lysozyme family protein